ncbi:MAG: gamma-glutamyltransferase family protein, partial [Planctomycetota bacterium]
MTEPRKRTPRKGTPDPLDRPHPQRIAVSPAGMVATAHPGATKAGTRMLEEGGNAVDAAVASAFALGVCEPAASGLGGQTMMTIHLAKERHTFALDGSSRAPNRATIERLTASERLRGHGASTVPSTPAVLRYALERYGTFKLARILEPAIELAQQGFEVTPLLSSLMKQQKKKLQAGNGAGIFLMDGRKPYPAGSILKQPALADTIRRLAKKGVKDFYSGRIAKAIHGDMVRNEGLIRRDDLAQVPRPIERRPVTARYRDARFMTFPPPGAGRTLVEMLNIYGNAPARLRNPDTAEGAVFLAQTIQRASRDRQDRPFDPEFYPQIRARRMLSPEYAKKIARGFCRRLDGDRGETTHLSVMDGARNAVALTQSIERVFGSCVLTEELGFLYNNYMSAFEYEELSHPYFLRPNAVPWASVAPTIGLRGKTPVLVIGSPGSERITPAILQVILRLPKGSPLEAVNAPRIHCGLDGTVSLEASRMRDDIPRALLRNGFTL